MEFKSDSYRGTIKHPQNFNQFTRLIRMVRLMAIKIVQLGTERGPSEGVRIGTVRRPPRGVPKSDYAKRNFYDVWLPSLSPGSELMKQGKSVQTESEWQSFIKQFSREMRQPEADQLLDLLSALSHASNFSIGCYCEDESRCHRSILRQLLTEKGATIDQIL